MKGQKNNNTSNKKKYFGAYCVLPNLSTWQRSSVAISIQFQLLLKSDVGLFFGLKSWKWKNYQKLFLETITTGWVKHLELLENKTAVSHNIPYFVVAKLLQCN